MNKPYNLYEQEASLTIGQAMALQSFSICCHLAGLNPVTQTEQLVTLLRREAERRSPEQSAAINAAYNRVLIDLMVSLVRCQLVSQETVAPSSKGASR